MMGEGLKFLFLLFEFTMKGLSLQTEKNEGFLAGNKLARSSRG